MAYIILFPHYNLPNTGHLHPHSASVCCASLPVFVGPCLSDKELEVLQSIADLTVKAAEQAMFKCEVSDEKVTGKWFKDGVEVQPNKRYRMTHVGRYSVLCCAGPSHKHFL